VDVEGVTEGSQRVAIFGATSAIAAEIARLYAGRGARLFLAGRSPEKLRALAAAHGGAVAGRHEVDLTAPGAADTAVSSAIAALGGGLDVAVIAHGLLGDQLASERNVAEAERIIDTNFLSVVALLVPLANHFEAAGRGHIAVLTSVAGDRGRPRNYTYGAAKAALNVYLQGVRTRLWPRGVGVHTMKLGPVDTPMTATHDKTLLFARADRVAAGIVAAIDAGRAEVYLPWFWRPIMAIVRHLPERVMQRVASLSGR
jgi:decaprenylphospho-beta-D-erythro-pentofuranosid-2-ulose 2-reductase